EHTWQDVAHDDPEARDPEGLGTLDSFALRGHQRRGADDPGEDHPPGNRQGDDHVGDARAEHTGDQDREQDARERELDVPQAHDQGITPAAEIARDEAENKAEHAGYTYGRRRDHHGYPGAG